MGFLDDVKSGIQRGGEQAKARFDEAMAEREEKRKAEAAAEQQRAKDEAATRQSAFQQAKATCPLPVQAEKLPLAGGLQLFNDEFVVAVAKDWGWSTEKLTLTTHRVLWSRGFVNTDQNSIYLTDIRDVRYHKSMMAHGKIVIETAGGHSIEGLPAASNGAAVRDRLMAMVHWARQRSQQPAQTAAPPQTAAPLDKFDQLRKLADLKSAGALTEEEFQTEKAKLLGL